MAQQIYGRWGGRGWSDGHYTVPGEVINFDGPYYNLVDKAFRDHDHAYDNAEKAYELSDKSAAYRIQYWGAIIAADKALIDQVRLVIASGTVSAETITAGLAAIDVFVHKQWSYNFPSLAGVVDPGVGIGGIAVDAITGMRGPGMVGFIVNTATAAAMNWVAPRRDPLVLDLDGNGISTSAINPNAPILFDQDGDGTLTATGWIAAGEAIVVRDLNGNGSIDSGRELFGDSTVLTRGPNVGKTATNGFEALADLDADVNGVSDGKFDANDVAFASVKLWQDANQNGISEAGELHTFVELGVSSINVSGTASNVNLGGGNTQTFSGSFTRANGQAGSAGTAELAGGLLLANNNFYRQFTDDPAITATDILNRGSFMLGGTGADTLPGGRGDDALVGGFGDDRMRRQTRAAAINSFKTANDHATHAWREAA